MIYGAVKEQKLKIKAQAAADTIDYLTARFTFLTADWDGLTKYAHFTKGTERYSVQLTDDEIKESDHLNLSQGEWQIYLHGNEYRNGDVIKRITTNIATFTVEPTGALNGEPFPEVNPSVVEQIAADVADHEERISELEQSAGEFVKDVETADGTSVVDENGVAHLPEEKTEMTEIMRSQGVSKYTASEIGVMYDNKKPMCYNGTPVTSVMILTLAGGAKEAYLGVLYGGTTATEARTLKINENKQITVYENGTTITEAQINKLVGIETGAEVNKVIDVLDSDGNSVVGADRKARLPEGGGTITDVQDEQGNSLVNEGVATIPKEVVEIYNGGMLIGTLAEINEMRRTKELKYQGYEFVYINLHTSSPNTYAVYYIRPSSAPNRPSLYMDIFNANYEITGAQEKVAEWSDENYTSTEKTKLSGIATGAEVNVIDTIKDSNGNPLTVTSKAVTLPAIPAAQIQADWEQSDNTAKDYIKNKPSIPAAQVQADWNESDNTKADYIKNKPTIPTAGTITSGSTGYATGGDVYTELQNIPSMPSGTNTGDILEWDGDEWVTKPKWQMTYQPVEYIESTGTQRIDTGLTGVDGIDIDLQNTSLADGYGMFGVCSSNNNTRYDLYYWSGLYFCTSNNNSPTLTLIDNLLTRSSLSHGVTDNVLRINEVEIATLTQTTSPTNINFNLFARAGIYGGTEYKYGKARIYSCNLYISQSLVRNYIPVRNVFTGEGGLYDLANNKFYENKGTGDFLIGPDVN